VNFRLPEVIMMMKMFGNELAQIPAGAQAMDFGQDPYVADFSRQIRRVDERDLQLWSIGLLVFVVVAAGFIGVVMPNLSLDFRSIQVNGRFLPQLFFGFIALVILFNIYAIGQRRALRKTRDQLLAQFIRGETAERLSLVDPLTQVFNRRHLETAVAQEVSRAYRRGSNFTFLMIDVDNFKTVNTRFGHPVGDQILVEVASLLRKTVRPTDTVFRYGGDEFLVILSETTEENGAAVVMRVTDEAGQWSKSSPFPGYTMSLSCGLASFSKGATIPEVLAAADGAMYRHKARATKAA
jgi:diguanylate cyclase (GGDEF)-like protein